MAIRWIIFAAAALAITAPPAVAETLFDIGRVERAALNAIQRCSSKPVTVLKERTTINVYRVPASVLDCLGIKPGIFLSPYGDQACGENCRPMPWAALREGQRAAIVSAASSDWGASAVTRVRAGIFVVTVKMVTHERNFIVRFDTEKVTYLTDGAVEVKDATALTFIAKGRKAYFWPHGGALWYDAVIDRDGRIFDVLPNFDTCLPRKEMARRTHIDLSRVTRAKICFNN